MILPRKTIPWLQRISILKYCEKNFVCVRLGRSHEAHFMFKYICVLSRDTNALHLIQTQITLLLNFPQNFRFYTADILHMANYGPRCIFHTVGLSVSSCRRLATLLCHWKTFSLKRMQVPNCFIYVPNIIWTSPKKSLKSRRYEHLNGDRQMNI